MTACQNTDCEVLSVSKLSPLCVTLKLRPDRGILNSRLSLIIKENFQNVYFFFNNKVAEDFWEARKRLVGSSEKMTAERTDL
uniref:Uncharacterized protein n=1 Tax=Megaselia scalaris TaxID=36166 RepID=T1H3T4_MEGSC